MNPLQQFIENSGKLTTFLESHCSKVHSEEEEKLMKDIFPEIKAHWCIEENQLKSFLKQSQLNLLKLVIEEVEKMSNKLIDRDTNFGMNESYRMAVDDISNLLQSSITSLSEVKE